jgi:hypothetical protein
MYVENYNMFSQNYEWADAIGTTLEEMCAKETPEEDFISFLSQWDPRGDIDNVLIKIIQCSAVDFQILTCLKNKISIFSSPPEILNKLFIVKNKNKYGLVASYILKMFDYELSLPEIEKLMAEGQRYLYDNDIDVEDAMSFLQNLRGEKDYAPIPPWVNIQDGENLSLLDNAIHGSVEEMSQDQLLEIIERGQEIFHQLDQKDNIQGKDVSLNLSDALKSALSSYSDFEDPDGVLATRLFGPVNRFMDRNCISKPGPCHMLECICLVKEDGFMEDEIIDKKYNNWFIGKCQVCLKKIANLSHALRIPEEDGGWRGCYCCIECIKEDVLIQNEKFNLRVNLMLNALQETGIMDRAKV